MYLYFYTAFEDKFPYIVHSSDGVLQQTNHSDTYSLRSRQTVDDTALNIKSHVYQSNIMSLLICSLHHMKYIQPSEVESQFHYVANHVIELLSYCHPTLLIERCRQLMASKIHKIKLFTNEYLRKLQSFKTSSAILKVLSVYFTWSNHSILKYLADFSPLAVTLLEEYNLQITLSYPIMNYTLPLITIPFDDDNDNFAFLTFHCKNPSNSLKQVYDLQSILIGKCEITQHALHLLSVKNNPIELQWIISRNIVDLINKMIKEHIQYFASNGINAILIYPNARYYIKYDVKFGPTITVLSIGQVIVKPSARRPQAGACLVS